MFKLRPLTPRLSKGRARQAPDHHQVGHPPNTAARRASSERLTACIPGLTCLAAMETDAKKELYRENFDAAVATASGDSRPIRLFYIMSYGKRCLFYYRYSTTIPKTISGTFF